MYVIAEIQGQQFKIEQGMKLFVHHIQDVEAGANVEFEKILLADKDGQVTVGAPTIDGAKVVCEVKTALVKGDKVIVFKKRRRKGYRKLNGHRQQFTELLVKEVVATYWFRNCADWRLTSLFTTLRESKSLLPNAIRN